MEAIGANAGVTAIIVFQGITILGILGLAVQVGKYIKTLELLERDYSRLRDIERSAVSIAGEVSVAVQRIVEVEAEVRALNDRWRSRFETR